jgi:hypothetical protein
MVNYRLNYLLFFVCGVSIVLLDLIKKGGSGPRFSVCFVVVQNKHAPLSVPKITKFARNIG